MGQLFVTVCGVADWSIFLASLPSRKAQRLEYSLIRIHRRERRIRRARLEAAAHAMTDSGGVVLDLAGAGHRRKVAIGNALTLQYLPCTCS